MDDVFVDGRLLLLCRMPSALNERRDSRDRVDLMACSGCSDWQKKEQQWP